MLGTDPYFVPTRSSAGKKVSHEVVTFSKTKPSFSSDSKRSVPPARHSNNELDMKKVRFEVYKFAQNALHGEDKQKSKIELAIKLGAKPPKNQYKNYKLLKEENIKKLEEAENNKELYNIHIKQRISALKSKKNKGTLRNKRKIGSGILNTYGKVTKTQRR